MKKLLIIQIVILTVISGCRYKENPLFPEGGTVRNRLQGTWEVVGFTSDGVDSLQYYKDSCGAKMKINFYNSDGSKLVSPTIGFFYGKQSPFGGEFFFSNNNKIMYLNGPKINIIGPIFNQGKWVILKLTKKEFKITTEYNNINYILSFKK